MPNWLKKQIREAFYNKNRYQIRILNDCWYYYTQKQKASERIS